MKLCLLYGRAWYKKRWTIRLWIRGLIINSKNFNKILNDHSVSVAEINTLNSNIIKSKCIHSVLGTDKAVGVGIGYTTSDNECIVIGTFILFQT